MTETKDYTVTDDPMEGFKRYIPTSHPWLKEVAISYDESEDGMPFVYIESHATPDAQKKIGELKKIASLLQPKENNPATASSKLHSEFDKIAQSIDAEPGLIIFEAIPTSNIRSFLTQANLPTGMQMEVMD
jgi:hypothetical protein